MPSSAPQTHPTTPGHSLSDAEAAGLREVYRHPAQPQRVDGAVLEALARAGLVTLECRSRLELIFVCGRVTAAGRAVIEATCPEGIPAVMLGPDIYFHAANQLTGQPVATFGRGVIGSIRLVSRASLMWVGYGRGGTALTDQVRHDEAVLAVYDADRPDLVVQLAPSTT